MDPNLYSRNNGLQMKENCNVIDKYFHSVLFERDESILEIGMGDGKFSMEIFLPRLPPKTVRRYVGSDISEKMVEFAKKQYHKKQNIEFIVLDPQIENIPDNLVGQFSYVVSFNCFHFFADAKRAIANIFTMLKPGGKIFASFLERNTEDDIFHNLSKHYRWKGYGHEKYVSNFYFSSDPQEEWNNTFTEAGFANIQILSEDRIHLFSGEKLFEDFFLALDPASSEIPANEREAYTHDYLQEVKRASTVSIRRNKKNGELRFTLDYRMLICIASKPLF